MPVTVAAVQFVSRFAQVEANAERLEALVVEAAAKGARIIVTPELALHGYISEDLDRAWHAGDRPKLRSVEPVDPAAYAQGVDGLLVARFLKLASSLGVYLTIPLLEASRTSAGLPRYFNSVVLASPDGRAAAHYRKLSPWPAVEPMWATAGNRGPQTCPTPWGTLGLAVCYDIHTICPRYAKLGIWTLLFCSAWVEDHSPGWWFENRLPQSAQAGGFHIVAANWTVSGRKSWCGYGFSRVIGRDGQSLGAMAELGEGIILAELPGAGESA